MSKQVIIRMIIDEDEYPADLVEMDLKGILRNYRAYFSTDEIQSIQVQEDPDGGQDA